MLPQAFLDRMKLQLGEEYPDFLLSLERPRAVALRFGCKHEQVPALPFLGDSVPWEPLGYYYDPDSRPGLHRHRASDSSGTAPVLPLSAPCGQFRFRQSQKAILL